MIRDSFYILSTRLVVIFINFVTLVLLARILGVEVFGAYSIVILIPNLLFLCLSLGLNTSTIYSISRYQDEKEIFITQVLLFGLLWGILGSTFFIILSETLIPSLSFTDLLSNSSLYIIVATTLLLIKYYQDAILQALGKFNLFNKSLLLQSFSALVLILFAFILNRLTLEIALLIFIVSTTLGIVVSFMGIDTYVKPALIFSGSYLLERLKYGFGAFISQLCMVMLYRVDIVMLDYMTALTVVGVYVLSARLIEMIWLIPDSVGLILFPKLMAKNEDKLALIVTTNRVLLLITVLSIIISALAIYPFILLFFGGEYKESVVLFLYLLPGTVFISLFKVLSRWFNSEGLTAPIACITLIFLLLNILFNLMLIPDYEAFGAALSSLLCYIGLGTSILIMFYRKHRNISIMDIIMPTTTDIKKGMFFLTSKLNR